MQAMKYADALSIHPTFSLVRDEREGYDVAAKRTREAQTDALRAENAKLAAERDAREQAKETEHAKKHGPRVRFQMIDGLRADDVDREIFRGRRAGDIGHRTVAFYLADCADRGLHQELGHSSAIVYAVKRHELSRRAARDLIAAGRALRELSKIDRAFAEAKISWSKARALAKVAEPPTEDRWLAFARTHTQEEVEKEVALCRKGEEPREDRRGLPEVRFDVRLRVSALLHEQYLLARQKLGADAGREVTDEEFAGALFETFLRKPAEGNRSSDSMYRVVLDLSPADGKVSIRSEDGPIDLDQARAEAICCDAGVVSEDGDRHDHHAPPISDALRDRILTRDAWRCRVCHGRFQLHVHHIVFRSKQGSNAWSNLLAVCQRCHTLVHGRYLTITGRAPDRIELRDRNGDLVEDPARLFADGDLPALEILPQPPVTVAPGLTGSGSEEPLNSGFAAEKPGVMTITPPARVDRDWVARHHHLLSSDQSRAAFRISGGRPVEKTPEDEPAGAERPDPLRPNELDEVIGQRVAVERLRTHARAAVRAGGAAAPILLLGGSGLGKTTLARAHARELCARLVEIDSTTLSDPMTILGHLMDLRDGDVVFLDEIQAIPKALTEMLYPAIEDGYAKLRFVDGVKVRTVPYDLPKVTWIAASTNPERLPRALRGRFSAIDLVPYEVAELAAVIRRVGERDGLDVSPDAAMILASASEGTARAAIGLYREMRTLVRARGGTAADTDDARTALRLCDLDEAGFGPVHRRILDVLRKHGRPLALRRLVEQVGITVEAFRSVYEPALFRRGSITSTRFGIRLGEATSA